MKKMKFKVKVPAKISRFANKAVLEVKKKSPEILFCVGVVSFGAAIVSAVKASRKADYILAEHEEDLEVAKCEFVVPDDYEDVQFWADNVELNGVDANLDDEDKDVEATTGVIKTQKEINRAVRKVYGKTVIKFIKLYSKTGGFVLIALACFGGVYKILSGRVAMGLATISGLESYISTYEKRNIELNGKRNHDMCKYGYKEIERTYEDPDTGEVVHEIERVPMYEVDEQELACGEGELKEPGIGIDEETREVLESGPSVIIFCKDETAEYIGVPHRDRYMADCAQADAERIWRTRGWVTENDIRSYLGMQPTVMGQRRCKFYHGVESEAPTLNIDAPINDAAKNGTRNSWIFETNLDEDLFLESRLIEKSKKDLEKKMINKRKAEEGIA